MLIGEFESKLTEKNRIAVPSKIRIELKGKIVLSRGYEGCLILLDQKRWNDLSEVFLTNSILNLSVRDTRRFVLGGASEIELDAQGRFVVPAYLKKYANIKNEIVFIGISDWVEVWSQENWNKKLEMLKKEAGDIAEKLLKMRK